MKKITLTVWLPVEEEEEAEEQIEDLLGDALFEIHNVSDEEEE